MRKVFPYLLHPETKIYHYAAPKELIGEKIGSIFKRSGKALSEPDFDGCFTSRYLFEMSVNSGAVTSGNAKFGSILHGTIVTADNGGTIVQTVTKVRFPLKLIAVVIPLLGFGYLYKGISEQSSQFLLLASAMIFVSPFVCNWLAGISNAAIQDRFERYIDKELSKADAPNTGLPI